MQATVDVNRKPGTVLLPGLRRAREARGLSIRQLADKAGVAPDTVWRLETGRRSAQSKTRTTLARVLGTTIRDLRTPDEAEEVNES